MAALGISVLSGLPVIGVVLNVACSGSATTSGNGSGTSPDSGASTGEAGNAGSSSGGSSGGGAGDAGTNPDNACAALSTTACSDCCINNHQSGSTVVDNAFYDCVCGPSNCQTQCAQTDCSSSADAGFAEAGDPCDLCEQQAAPADGGGACGPQITAACNASADCVAFFQCENNCP
jgi:hypothetical protein